MTKHYAVIGLGFGDETKGATVDWLCAEKDINTVVRFSGGCQAAHNVITEDGRHHTFAMFGSGTFRGAATVLAAPTMIEPFAICREAEALIAHGETNIFNRLFIDDLCRVTTPYHWIANRLTEEARGVNAHGSCGRGIGETRTSPVRLRAMDLSQRPVVTRVLNALHAAMRERFPDHIDKFPEPAELIDQYLNFGRNVHIGHVTQKMFDRPAVFEGSQGVLLDENRGFFPHNTWSDTTAANVNRFVEPDDLTVLGVVRTYTTRHGAGPMPTEDHRLDLPEPHNGTGRYQGAWRNGHFDAPLHRYAVRNLRTASDSRLVISHVDREGEAGFCRTYVDEPAELGWPWFYPTAKFTQRLGDMKPVMDGRVTVGKIVDSLGLPLFGVASGPTAADRQFVSSLAVA